ncbi:hypothetical protein [Microbulbifer sp. SH-1]|nr:hypothetical protein [Microbulbifer sp. SH-1]
MAVKPIPEGMNTVTPYLCVKGAAAAIDFYCPDTPPARSHSGAIPD